MNKLIVFLFLSGLMLAVADLAQTRAGSDAVPDQEFLLQMIRANKKTLIVNNMELTDGEGKQFWPLYEEYQKELEQLTGRMDKNIKEYSTAFVKGPIPDETAKKLLDEALSIQEGEFTLNRAYANKIGKVLPWAKTARYLQLENRIRAVLRAETAELLPLAY